jgi:hypothetical protein
LKRRNDEDEVVILEGIAVIKNRPNRTVNSPPIDVFNHANGGALCPPSACIILSREKSTHHIKFHCLPLAAIYHNLPCGVPLARYGKSAMVESLSYLQIVYRGVFAN